MSALEKAVEVLLEAEQAESCADRRCQVTAARELAAEAKETVPKALEVGEKRTFIDDFMWFNVFSSRSRLQTPCRRPANGPC